MRVLLALLLAAQQPPAGEEPRGTSQDFGAERYDALGYASWYGEESGGTTASGARFDPAAITAAHRTLPLGSFVEVTALDTGRTIVVLINDRGPGRADRLIDLSRGAAHLLGVDRTPIAPVRVRRIFPAGPDQAALRAGHAAGARLDASPQLLAALRKRLSPPAGLRPAAAAPVKPQPASAAVKASVPPVAKPVAAPAIPAPPASAPRPAVNSAKSGAFFVQVASFSSGPRAQALAKRLGGAVDAAGGIHRVRLGPYATREAAWQARENAIRLGYGDARLIGP